MKKRSTNLSRIVEAHGFTLSDLAQTVGISLRSMHNLACGNAKSQTTRQKIATFLGESPWSDIVPEIPIPAGTIIQFRGEKEAAKFVALTAPGEVEVRRDTVRLLTDLTVRANRTNNKTVEISPSLQTIAEEIAEGGRKRLWPEEQS